MAHFAMTAKNATMPNGNTPMEKRGTTTLLSGFSHKGFPEAVEQHVIRGGSAVSCHNWRGPTERNGYPMISYDSYTFSARRWIYEYVNDCVITKGLSALTTCGNPLCVNPEHLTEGNLIDQIKNPGYDNEAGRAMKVPSRARGLG